MIIHLSKFFLALAPLSVVFVASSTLFPFIGVKAYWFRLCVSLALIAFLGWVGFQSSNEEIRRLFKQTFSSPLVLAVTIFAVIFVLASVFAYDSSSAFWSNFERGEGGFQMIYYYLFFLLLVLIGRDKKIWRLFLWTMLAAAVFVIGYGFWGDLSAGGLLSNRFAGSLGNPAYLGSYLLFSLFFAGFLIFDGKTVGWQRFLLSGLFFLFSLFILFTQTRGAFLGLIVGLAAFLLFVVFQKSVHRRLFLTAVIVLIIGFSTAVYFRQSPMIKDLPVVGRLFRISVFDRSVQSRLWVWRTAYEGFKERPLFGWGPENFAKVFNNRFDTRHFVPAETSDTWYDRAHSVFFDYLVETGILGFLSYLGIFAAFYWQFLSKMRINAERKFLEADRRGNKQKSMVNSQGSIVSNALLFAFPITYLTQGIILFEILPVYLSFFFFLAFSVYKFQND